MAIKRGQIRKRGAESFQIRVFLGRNTAGQRKYHTETIRGSKKDAERALTAKLGKLDNGRLTENPKLTVETFLLRWLETAAKQQVRPRTFESYRRLMTSYVVPSLGMRKLTRLSALEIQELANSLSARGLSSRTVRYTIAVFRQALKQAVRWKLLPTNPIEAGDIKLPAQKRAERTWLSRPEVSHFLKAAEGTRLEALWHVAIASAMRPGEYLALTWADVDLFTGQVTVRRTLQPGGTFGECKTQKSRRTIPLPKSTARILREHKRKQAEERLIAGGSYINRDLVFATVLGMPLDHNNLVHYHFKPLLKKATLPQIRLYDLRHSSATLLLEAGENLKVVSERLGHASITLTADVYAHVSPTMQAQAAEKLEAVLFSK